MWYPDCIFYEASSILYGFIEFETRLGRPHQYTSQSPSLDSTSLSDVASLLTHTDSNVDGSCTSTTSSVCIQRWRIDFNPAYCSLEGAIVVKWNVWCLRCGGNEEVSNLLYAKCNFSILRLLLNFNLIM